MKKAKLGHMMSSSNSIRLTTLLDKDTRFRHKVRNVI